MDMINAQDEGWGHITLKHYTEMLDHCKEAMIVLQSEGLLNIFMPNFNMLDQVSMTSVWDF